MKISIIGSGIVGQATGIGFTTNGNRVKFYDIDKGKLLALKSKGYDTTDNLVDAVNFSDILFVCVPTPTVGRKIDYRYIYDCTKTIANALEEAQKYTVVTYRSTIPPQTTRTNLIPLLETYSNLKAGADFGVCMNPEFLREKSAQEDFLNPNRIVVGALDERSGVPLRKIYSSFKCPIIFTDLDTAEMIKYASNTFLAAKISFFNEIYLICQKLNINPKIVATAAALDPRIGSYGVDGGKPFGGMCLPKDLYAFIYFTKSMGLNPAMLQAIAKVNEEIGLYCSTKQEPQIEVRLPQTCSS
ncbi:MAG: nucleotide sugar dehydrogenase [Candidatus Bathyarchaeota archaeon]|nr:nucleotide sugar dehydrogenase [Candidatus Bathyarchaeota archaeon]